MEKLPPHNQRRLNVKIAEIHGERYADWYDLAREMQLKGATYADIADHFKLLGVPVSVPTISIWIRERTQQESNGSAAAQAA